jgi:hypothetical protein
MSWIKPFRGPAVGLSFLVCAYAAAADPAPPPAARPPTSPPLAAAAPGQAAPAGDMTVDQALDALDQRGQDLRSFTAKVSLKEQDADTMLGSVRTGQVWYQQRAPGDARMRVTFDEKSDVDGKKITRERIEYMLDQGWLDDRDYQKKIQVKRQILRPGEHVNLLKLGEGPFPLPIGQKKEEVRKLFKVEKVKLERGDPTGTVHLVLTPIPKTQFAGKFSSIDVWMDPKSHMPVRIDTADPKGKIIRSTQLDNVSINPPLADKDFDLPPIKPEEWNIHVEPFKD